jgi:hypothetical protein
VAVASWGWMRLYLSSFRMGNRPGQLRRLAGESMEAAVIANAMDGDPATSRQAGGPCVLGPTIRGFEATDDPSIVPTIYGDEPIWTGMDIIDFVVVPHVGSPEHPVSALLTQLAANYRGRRPAPPRIA